LKNIEKKEEIHGVAYIFIINVIYQGETYEGSAYVRLDNPQFFTWELKDKYGEEFDLNGHDLYEFDSLLQEMGDKYLPKIYESRINSENLLDAPFITKKDGKYYLPAATKNTYNDFNKKSFTRTFPLDYESFMRYLILAWMKRYNGDNELLLKTKKDLEQVKDTDETKSLGMLSLNKLFYIKFVGDVIGVPLNELGSLHRNKKYDILQLIWENRDKIFTEENITKALKLNIMKLKGATQSEEDAIELINKYNLVPYYTAKRVTKDITDKTGIDIWLIPEDKEMGKAKRGQVKAPANAWIKYFDGDIVDNLIIKGSKSLDLGRYVKKEGDKLRYDVLIIVDMKRRKIYTIPTYIIYSIKQNDKGTWSITMRKRSLRNKDVKVKEY